MSTCLVKFNGSLGIDIPKYGELRISLANQPTKSRITIGFTSSVTISARNGGTFAIGSGSTTTENLTTYTTGNSGWAEIYGYHGAVDLSISNKYALIALETRYAVVDPWDVIYIKQYNKFLFLDGNFTRSISLDKLISYDYNDSRITQLRLIQTNNITGSILAACKFMNLTNIGLGNSISGDLLDFARNQILAGRESATISGNWLGQLTFNSEALPNVETNSLHWEKSGNDYVVTMTAGSSFTRTVTIDA